MKSRRNKNKINRPRQEAFDAFNNKLNYRRENIMEKDAVRLYIIARALLNLDAHYLNGSDGGHPGMKDGFKGRDVKLVERGDFGKVAVHTATYSNKSCTGRYDKVGGYIFKPNSEELQRLEKYCEKNIASGKSPQFWEPFENGLYPRKYKPVKGEAIYLGEDCRNIRHFDCINFVNWVLKTALQKSFSYSIEQYEGKKVSGGGVIAPVETFKPPFPALQNADILTRINWDHTPDDKDGIDEDSDWKIDSKHIGFYMAGGNVINASEAKTGVIISKYDQSKWTGMSRIKDSHLKFGA